MVPVLQLKCLIFFCAAFCGPLAVFAYAGAGSPCLGGYEFESSSLLLHNHHQEYSCPASLRVASTGHFWQISDIHVDNNYAKHACRGALGDIHCDAPLNLWISALNAMREFGPKAPDFIVFSGDSVGHMTESQTDFETTMEAVSTALRAVFPAPTPVVVAIGNHDVYPDNEMSVAPTDSKRRQWCTKLGTHPRLWGPWVANASGADGDRFPDGCFYARKIKVAEGTVVLRVISLNGLIYAKQIQGNDPTVVDPLGQFEWLRQQLTAAREHSESVLVVMHFPLGDPENGAVVFRHLYDAYNSRLIEIFTEFSDVISAGLFAHQHTDSFRVLSSSSPLLPFFNMPSLSPMYFHGLGAFAPRIRLYSFVTTPRFHLTDFSQFQVYNLTSSEPAWGLEYVASEVYNLSDLSAVSLGRLLTQLDSNHTMWCSYWSHELGAGMEHDSGPCPALNSLRHCRHVCVMRHMNYTALDDCLADCVAKLGASGEVGRGAEKLNAIPAVALVMFAFLAILIGVVLVANRGEVCGKRRSAREMRRRRRQQMVYNLEVNGSGDMMMMQEAVGDEEEEEEEKEKIGLKVVAIPGENEGAYDADASAEEEEDQDEDCEPAPPKDTEAEAEAEEFFSVTTTPAPEIDKAERKV